MHNKLTTNYCMVESHFVDLETAMETQQTCEMLLEVNEYQ